MNTDCFLSRDNSFDIWCIPYEDYTRLFFEMIDQPMPQISTAQQNLSREFDSASVRITSHNYQLPEVKIDAWRPVGTDKKLCVFQFDQRKFNILL